MWQLSQRRRSDAGAGGGAIVVGDSARIAFLRGGDAQPATGAAAIGACSGTGRGRAGTGSIAARRKRSCLRAAPTRFAHAAAQKRPEPYVPGCGREQCSQVDGIARGERSLHGGER